ncbi:MAG: redoxin domain-containing protein [Acidobacteria bacterium]|nr:redoxin domain-containing protein [Acidobacteriota bacterium]
MYVLTFLLLLWFSTSEGEELIGRAAPELEGLMWVQGGPLRLSDLRGSVVLVRFWLDGCPFCEATAPALNELREKYAGDGLVVIGIHHPKPPGIARKERVLSATGRLRFRFPVATDPDWKTLRSFWLDTGPRQTTSASFLIDQRGVIRYVHPGVEFHRSSDPAHRDCNRSFLEIDRVIGQLLKIARP